MIEGTLPSFDDGLPYLVILPVLPIIHRHLQIILRIPAELIPCRQGKVALPFLIDSAVLRITVMVLPYIVEEILTDDAEEVPLVYRHILVPVLPQYMPVTSEYNLA